MQVIATAGHVDHGKSTLVRALTGMEPDRWAEERRRGMTIDLGFAWTTLPSGRRAAFVDVPGHERFVTNMLAGVGPAPVVMLVVAADEGWRAQTAEHLAALDALGVSKGLLVITRADLADPGRALAEARDRLSGTALADAPHVVVSGHTRQGLPELVTALDRLAAPAPDRAAAIRLWIDRAFTIRGAGTVVTGTLTAGTLRTGDELLLDGQSVKVRGLQSLQEASDEVTALARVAVNLRGVDRDQAARGMTLLSPGAWLHTQSLDVRLGATAESWRRTEAVFHIGSAAVAAKVRVLGGDVARLTLSRPLPLRIGDRGLLRGGGIVRADVLDVRPPSLTRRGAAATRAAELATGIPTAADLLRRHRVMRRSELTAIGLSTDEPAVTGDWLADPAHWADLTERLAALVTDYSRQHPLRPGISAEEARAALDLPDRQLVGALVHAPLRLKEGRVLPAGSTVPDSVLEPVERLRAEPSRSAFQAPEAARLAELGFTRDVLSAAARAGLVLRLAEQVVLAPGADLQALAVLAELPQPFTVSDARRALDTTRRVAVPLLEHLDRQGLTRRDDRDRRQVIPS